MKIVTWNCYRGEIRARADELLSFDFDVAVLQECGRPDRLGDDCAWFEVNPQQGVGVITRNGFTVEAGNRSPDLPHSVFPFRVGGREEFDFLGVWSMPKPTYVAALLQGIEIYRDALARPCVVAGDFNSHPRFDKGSTSHASVTAVLAQHGLASVYHRSFGEVSGQETRPTYYHQWKQEQPFHLDYCFLSEPWLARLESVEVGGFAEWADRSDHRPMVVEVAAAGTH